MDNVDAQEPRPDDSNEYWRKTEKAMETIRGSVEAGDVDAAFVSEFIQNVQKLPLVKFDFFNDQTGEELTGSELMLNWYGKSTGELTDATTPVYLAEQKMAANLANKIIEGFGFKSNEIKLQYGPFAKHIDAGSLAIESSKANMDPKDKELLSDPENLKFVQEKVYGVAVPNIVYTTGLQNELRKDFEFKK